MAEPRPPAADRPPSMFHSFLLSVLLKQSREELRELVALLEREELPRFAHMARQCLAWRNAEGPR